MVKRKGYKTIEEQQQANQRWADKNREHRTYLSARSTARSFIRNKATFEDLEELTNLIEERKSNLK